MPQSPKSTRRTTPPAKRNGILDLSDLAAAPVKVKLPDGKLYSMANPAEMGVLDQQKLLAKYRRAQELMANTEASAEDADEMLSMLIDVAQVVVPGANRELLGQLNLTKMERLTETFFQASPAATQRAEAAPEKATSAS